VNLTAIHLIAGALATVAGLPLERPEREDTIYVVRGEAEELEAFEEELGKWQGGELIDEDVDAGTYTFWAYSERTASQARQFLMPAALSGLQIDVLNYDQEYAFPEIRARADSIAIECGATQDPFFIKPTGAIQLFVSDDLGEDIRACLKGGLRSSEAEELR
jgi:hypothetical protein